MNFLEEKRETNNYLCREYYHNKKDEKYLNALINYNYDLVSYTILKYFRNIKYNKEIYEIGLVSMIEAIESYEMDKMCGFEEYVVAYIKLGIAKFDVKLMPTFICNNEKECLNVGDIWYNKTHNLKDTLDTKEFRDKIVIKEYKKVLQDKDKIY